MAAAAYAVMREGMQGRPARKVAIHGRGAWWR
jgi:hypothetical protein